MMKKRVTEANLDTQEVYDVYADAVVTRDGPVRKTVGTQVIATWPSARRESSRDSRVRQAGEAGRQRRRASSSSWTTCPCPPIIVTSAPIRIGSGEEREGVHRVDHRRHGNFMSSGMPNLKREDGGIVDRAQAPRVRRGLRAHDRQTLVLQYRNLPDGRNRHHSSR